MWLEIAKLLLGMGNGASVANTLVGAAGHVSAFAAFGYLAAHRTEIWSFEASFGFLAMVVAVAYAMFEMARRTRPGAKDQA